MSQHQQSRPFAPTVDLHLKCFRAFQDSGPISLSPLTVLVGRNSSGKSSIVNAILMLAQSLESRSPSTRLGTLKLRGALCDLGSFDDVVFNHRVTSPIGLGFRFHATENAKDFAGPWSPLVSVPIPVTQIPQGRFRRFYAGQPRLELHDGAQVSIGMEFSDDAPHGPSLSAFSVRTRSEDIQLTRTTGDKREQHWRTYIHGLPKQSVEMARRGFQFFPALGRRNPSYASVGPRIKQRINRFLYAADSGIYSMERFASSVAVVGPFRTPPERIYAFSGGTPATAGLTGEQAVNHLITEYLTRPKDNRPLHRAVSFWLEHLGLADSLEVDTLAKKASLFQLGLSRAGHAKWANISDVGFGVSQILPVIVQGLTLRPGSTYVVQQPEIHLHPDAQASLADFFIYLSIHGIRVIVETHSEYMLIRIRRRLAERWTAPKVGLASEAYAAAQFLTRAQVAIHRIELHGKKGAAVHTMPIDDAFQFEDLPPGFMSQALDDRMALLKGLRGAKA